MTLITPNMYVNANDLQSIPDLTLRPDIWWQSNHLIYLVTKYEQAC